LYLDLRRFDIVKRNIPALVLAFTLLSLPLFGACTDSTEEVIELTYSNFFPSTHLNSILAEEWIKEIETRTDGAVKITYYPAGSLTPAAGVYDGVVEGISDIGMSCLAYTPGRFPACELVDMPHSYPNGWVATKVANDFYNEFTPTELDDVHVFYFHAHGPGVIFSTDQPIRELEDMNGLVIRATGIGAKIVDALGAEGYGASQGDAYELMSKDVVDGSYAPREVLKGWNQADVVKYVTGCYDVGNTTDMYVVINEDVWDSMPADIQQVFNDVSQEWIEKHGMVWDYYDKVAIDYFLSLGEGREIIELTSDEMAKWVEAVSPVVDNYIVELESEGLPGEEYEQYLLERVEYWTSRSPSLAESFSWVEDELLPSIETE
jgi:TRAP-type C4-dicarboxylate transport system substrate-binding protein